MDLSMRVNSRVVDSVALANTKMPPDSSMAMGRLTNMAAQTADALNAAKGLRGHMGGALGPADYASAMEAMQRLRSLSAAMDAQLGALPRR